MIHPGWTPVPLGHVTALSAPQGSSPWASLLNTHWWYAPPAGPGPPPAPDDRYRDDFKWDNPRTQRDGEAGGICEVSHAWFPASRLHTMEDGKVVGDAFAYRNRPFPDIERETWGEPRE